MTVTQKILALLINSFLLFGLTGCGDGKRESTIENSASGSSETAEEPINTNFETPTKLKDYVTGDWTADTQAGTSGRANQRIEFTRDGKYTRYTGDRAVESGLYRVNEQHRFLYLDAERPGQPTEWDVTINSDNQMTLKVRNGSAHGESYSFTYIRRN